MKVRNNKFMIIAAAVLFIGLLLTGCGGGTQQPPANNNQAEQPGEELPGGFLEIQGSDTMVNLGQALAEKYMDEVNVNASIAVTGGGSGTGIAAMINDNVDIAQSSRKMKDSEFEQARANGVEVFEFVIAQDGVAMVVNAANPIENVTMAQLKDILTGKITKWSELGWAEGGDISIYSRQSNSGTYVFVNETIMDGEDFADGTMFLPGSSAIVEAVENDRNAIGYFGVGYVKGNAKALSVAREEGGEYVTPMVKANIDDGKYPVARPLYFYINGAPEGLKLHYLKWVLSPEGQKVVEDTGFYSFSADSDYAKANAEAFRKTGVN